MIELAPAHKNGLPIANPVLLAAGSIGMGEATHNALDISALGGVVVGPLSRRSRAGSETPRIAEVPGGIVLETGGQNRGLDATLKHFAAQWGRFPVPVIVQIIDNDVRMLAEVAGRLATVAGVVGIEWMPPARTDLRTIRIAIEQMIMEGDLPVLLRPPLARTLEWGRAAVEAGVDALTIGAPPEAAAPHSNALASTDPDTDLKHPPNDDGRDSLRSPGLRARNGGHSGRGGPGYEHGFHSGISLDATSATTHVTGSFYGPGVFPQMLVALVEAREAGWGVPLVASGGIYSIEQARTALDAGAAAIQIDVAVWVEPELPGRIARAVARGG